MTTTVSPGTDAEPELPAEHGMQCMEIWGGNKPVAGALSVLGMDVWIYSDPHRDTDPQSQAHGDEDGGGDIYYISTCGGGKVSRFVVADVSGHGASVGGLAESLRALMHKYVNTLDQTQLAQSVNREFGAFAESGHFATALLTTYFAEINQLIVCNAGHPPPLLYRAQKQSWHLLEHDLPGCCDKADNLPLGIKEPTDYWQFAVSLEKSDLVLIYTDSLIEARNSRQDDQQLGLPGLLELARGLDVTRTDTIGSALLDGVAEWRGGQPPNDDQTLVVLHHNAEDSPHQSMSQELRGVDKMLGLIHY